MASEDSSQTEMVPSCSKEVKKLPMVEWASSKMSDLYVKIKNSNKIVNKAFNSMECMSDMAVKMVSPLVGKMRKPLNFLNGFMCGSLCWLENKVPMIKEPPQKVYDFLQNNATRVSKPFSKLGCALKTALAFLLTQVSKLPALPLRVLESTEGFLDNLFPMETDKCESEASSEASSRTTFKTPGNSLVHTAESVGRLSFKLIRAGFLISTAPLRCTYSLISFQCVPRELVEDEMIVYSKNRSGESSSVSSDHESDKKRKSPLSSQSD